MEEKYINDNVSRLRRENGDLKKMCLICEKRDLSISRVFLKGTPVNIRLKHIWEVTSRDKYLGLNRIKCITIKQT